MKCEVEFFGLGYHTIIGQKIIGCKRQKTPFGWRDVASQIKEIKKRRYYLYLQLSKQITKPIIFWTGDYKAKWAMDRIEQIRTNPAKALVLMRDPKQIKAIRELANYKVKFFGNADIPIKALTEEEIDRFSAQHWNDRPALCYMFEDSWRNK